MFSDKHTSSLRRGVLALFLGAFMLATYQMAANAAGTATFVGSDTTTQGNWKGIYGADGYHLAGDKSSNNPSDPFYAALTNPSAAILTYSTTTTDPRALRDALPASSQRIAAAYASATGFGLGVMATDSAPHQIALYMVDWNNAGRTQTVTISDFTSGAVLDKRTVSSFSNGIYLAWSITGHVLITITNTGSGSTAVLSGWFFDYPGPVLSRIAVSPSSASVAAGASQQFTAVGLDQSGNPLVAQPAFTWAVHKGGTISNKGLFKAGSQTTAPFLVTANSGSILATASAQVASTHTVIFGSKQDTEVIGQTDVMAVTDIDGDGHLDLVVQTQTGLAFLFGKGDGTFTTVAYPYTISNLRSNIATGDLKGNHKIDIVCDSGDSLAVVMNLGSRTFAAPVLYAAAPGANGIALGDFNEDDRLDIANVGSGSVPGGGANQLAILLNNGDGTFGAPALSSVPANYYGYTVGVAALDIDSDGHLDLACNDEDELAASEGAIFFGDGAGNFSLAPNWLVEVGGGRLIASDLNNDGILDLVSSDHWAGQPRWALGNGKGGFPYQNTIDGAGYAGTIGVGDYDGDGYGDMVQTYSSSTNELLYINNGNGTFATAVRDTLAGADAIVGDFNEDGQPDLAGGLESNNVSLYLNTTNPAPTITNLSPDGASVGATQGLVIQGHGFLSRSVVDWNGSPLPTTFNYHSGMLAATLTPTLLASAGTATVTVTTGGPGGGTSNSLSFYVGNTPTAISIEPIAVHVIANTLVKLAATVHD